MRGAIDEAVAFIDRRIRKNKTRLARNLRPDALTSNIPAEFDVVEEPEYHLVRTKHFAVKPMSTEEAILQMNLLDHSFYVFRSVETGHICVVYRRNNGAVASEGGGGRGGGGRGGGGGGAGPRGRRGPSPPPRPGEGFLPAGMEKGTPQRASLLWFCDCYGEITGSAPACRPPAGSWRRRPNRPAPEFRWG